MKDTKRMIWLSKRRRHLLSMLRKHPKEIGFVWELVQVNVELKSLSRYPEPEYVSELYRREDWIAETN